MQKNIFTLALVAGLAAPIVASADANTTFYGKINVGC